MSRTEGGYALVAAVIAVAAFAYIAFEVLAADQGATAEVRARIEQAKLAAAADGAIALAVHGLSSNDGDARWTIDGRERRIDFQGVDLAVRVEDERGKAALASLTDDQARALFAGAGATGDRLDRLVEEFRDWQQANSGAPASAIAKPGLQPRHAPFRTVGELNALRDMDPSLYARIAPVTTVFFENSGPFDPRNAEPLAIRTMQAEDAGAEAEPPAQPDIVADQPVEQIDDESLIGRTLTVRVVARASDGAILHRSAIVELTGDPARPYWVRFVE